MAELNKTSMQGLVDAVWVQAHLNDPHVRFVDVRPTDPRMPYTYQSGHIPGAVSLDPRALITGGRPAALVAAGLGRLGLGPDDTLVVYDDGIGPLAGMAFWALKHHGHRDVRVLNGGWAAWEEAGGEVSTLTPTIAPTMYTLHPDSSQHATLGWVLESLNNSTVVLLDCRSPAEYLQGHLPGAVNRSWDESVDGDAVVALKDTETLRTEFERMGVSPDKEIVAYCQSGARSSHSYMVLKMLGYARVRNYNGSWQEWSTRPDTPKEM